MRATRAHQVTGCDLCAQCFLSLPANVTNRSICCALSFAPKERNADLLKNIKLERTLYENTNGR